MAQTYLVADALAVLAPLMKNVGGLTAITPQLCDMVSSEIWTAFPWRVSVTNIPTTSIPLVDGTQDYSAPTNIYRLTQIGIRRTDTTPDQYRELTVARTLSEDLDVRSWQSIRSACLQPSIGKLRLESAVSVPSGTTLEMGGEYQLNPTKITSTGDDLWFEDQHLHVFIKGLLYWAYKLSDDARALPQLAEYRSAVEMMARSEDYGTIEGVFPEATLGIGKDALWVNNFFGG